MPLKTCPNCTIEYNASKSKRVYCSVACVRRARAVKLEKINCKNCLKEFTADPKHKRIYCGHPCAASYINRDKPKKAKLTACFGCGVELIAWQMKYCDSGCKTRTYIKNWLSGINNGSDKNGTISSVVRNFLLESANNQCSRCGWHEINPFINKTILTVDHIDGNWKNNSINNLKVLCYNCHTLTPTFGSLNIGNGAGKRGTYNRYKLSSSNREDD